MKNNLVFLVSIFSIFSFVLPSSGLAAGFSYGSVVAPEGSDKAVLTYKTLDSIQTSICDLDNLECDADSEETVPASQQSIPGVMLTPDKKHAVAWSPSFLVSLNLETNQVESLMPRAANDRYFAFPTLSPDGRYLAYYSPGTQSEPLRQFKLVDFINKQAYVLTDNLVYWDLLSEESMLFQFSPDSNFLIYKDDRNGPQTLYRLDLNSLSGTSFQGSRLFSRDYSVSDFVLLDSRTLIYMANREAPNRFDLLRYDLLDGSLKTIAEDVSYYPSMKRSGDLVLFNRLTSWGSEVVAYDVKKDVVKTFSRPQEDLESLEAGESVALSGGLHGALLLPEDFDPKDRHDLVIWLHGGPYRQSALGYHPYPSYGVYDWTLDGLRDKGAIVLKLDYTGSFGYGRPFAESIQGNVGVKDVGDVLAALDDMQSDYRLGKVYLAGVSYGGYLALRTLVEAPESFEGVVSVNGVTDWLTLVNSNPNTIFAADFEGPLNENNEGFYDRASILSATAALEDQEVLLIHSTNDRSVSFSQSTSYANILQQAGKNVHFEALEGEDHILSTKVSAMKVCELVFELMDLKVGGECAL